MQVRLRRLARILDAQGQMHRREEAELARVVRDGREVETRRHDLVQALGGLSPFHGLFPAPMAHRLNALAIEQDRLRADGEARAGSLIASGIKRKRTERLIGRLRVEHGAALEKQAWLQHLEAFAVTAGGGPDGAGRRGDVRRGASSPSASDASLRPNHPSTAPVRPASHGRQDSEVP
ncbi:hypothetical protein [Methylobacterium sp. 1030]|uniref:hypothetical protein n=1 Tax=Methylobacterium sp. 1030 TaxID=3156404 RepID=UPI00339A5C9D